MATNNSIDAPFTNNADGFDISGGTTPRKLTITAGNLTLSSGGANTYTFPSATDTLVGRASTDTLTNKTLTSPVINQFGTASGLGAAWTAWTPSFTNLSGGTITTATYIQIGKTIHYVIHYTLAGANISGSVTFSPPVTAASDFNSALYPVGQATYENSGVATYMGYIAVVTTTSFRMYVNNAASTYVTADTVLSSTVPHTWKSGDSIRITGTYECA